MKNREKIFYKLTSDSNLNEIYKLSESTESDMFFKMGWWTKFGSNLRIYNNNIAFLDRLEGFENLNDLREELYFQFENQLYNYTQKEWLEHTLFICRDRFRESGKEILTEAIKWCENRPKQTTIKNKYAIKEVKIAYFCIGEMITNQNYLSILKKHTVHRSNKILQNPITKNSDLTATRENKAADTKHLKSLKGASHLLSGIKKQSAIKTLNQAISTFESNCRLKYD